MVRDRSPVESADVVSLTNTGDDHMNTDRDQDIQQLREELQQKEERISTLESELHDLKQSVEQMDETTQPEHSSNFSRRQLLASAIAGVGLSVGGASAAAQPTQSANADGPDAADTETADSCTDSSDQGSGEDSVITSDLTFTPDNDAIITAQPDRSRPPSSVYFGGSVHSDEFDPVHGYGYNINAGEARFDETTHGASIGLEGHYVNPEGNVNVEWNWDMFEPDGTRNRHLAYQWDVTDDEIAWDTVYNTTWKLIKGTDATSGTEVFEAGATGVKVHDGQRLAFGSDGDQYFRYSCANTQLVGSSLGVPWNWLRVDDDGEFHRQGLRQTDNSAIEHTLSDDEQTQIVPNSRKPMGMATIVDTSSREVGLMLLRWEKEVSIVADPGDILSTTEGNEGTLNVYFDQQNERTELENKLGYENTFSVTFHGNPFF